MHALEVLCNEPWCCIICWQFDMKFPYATHLTHPVLCRPTHLSTKISNIAWIKWLSRLYLHTSIAFKFIYKKKQSDWGEQQINESTFGKVQKSASFYRTIFQILEWNWTLVFCTAWRKNKTIKKNRCKVGSATKPSQSLVCSLYQPLQLTERFSQDGEPLVMMIPDSLGQSVLSCLCFMTKHPTTWRKWRVKKKHSFLSDWHKFSEWSWQAVLTCHERDERVTAVYDKTAWRI